MEIDAIYQSIQQWKILTDAFKNGNQESETEILKYLNQGTHFSVSGAEIVAWKNNLANATDKAIHAYVGIDQGVLKFFLIDSKSDADSDFSHILVKEFTRKSPDVITGIDTNLMVTQPPITSESAIYRNFTWNMYGSPWLKVQKTQPFFQLIYIPFDDYERLNLADNQLCTCFFGLTNETQEIGPITDYHIEIITVKDLTINEISKDAQDYSTPRPPFTISTIEDYQLLLKSDAYL